jgi:hypothetical protein
MRRQHAAALPDREAMSLLLPVPELPFMPSDGADPIAPGPGADGGAGGGTAEGATNRFTPDNQAQAVNELSSGAVQGSSSTQSAPITQRS